MCVSVGVCVCVCVCVNVNVCMNLPLADSFAVSNPSLSRPIGGYSNAGAGAGAGAGATGMVKFNNFLFPITHHPLLSQSLTSLLFIVSLSQQSHAPISSLNPYSNKFLIRCRITAKVLNMCVCVCVCV